MPVADKDLALQVLRRRVNVEVEDPDIRAFMVGLLRDLTVEGSEADTQLEVRSVVDGAGTPAIEIATRDRTPHLVPDREHLVDFVVASVNRLATTGEGAATHLHAGAVVLGGRAALISGHSGSGKSTFVAACLLAGFGYLSDELVAVEGAVAHAYPKPLSLRVPTQELLPELAAHVAANGSDGKWYVPASSIRSDAVVDAATIGLIGFLDLERGGTDRHVAIPPQAALVRLATECFDARTHPDLLSRLAELVSTTPAVILRTADLDAAVAHLEQLLERPPSPSRGIRSWHDLPRGASGPGPGRGPDVEGVRVGDGGVLHHTGTGELLELDGVGVAVWERLDGRADADSIASSLELPEGISAQVVRTKVRGFVEQLGDYGFLDGVDRTTPLRAWRGAAADL